MFTGKSKRVQLSLVGLLVMTALFGVVGVRTYIRAAAKATYTVYVGMSEPYGVEANAFGPQTIKVHRGDTITWQFMSFHNIRFDTKPVDFVIPSQIDGKTVLEANPVVAFPTIKNGGVYTPGGSSGLPGAGPGGPSSGPPTFSVVMDVAPGTYTYVCDIHPGMVGTITVVDDNTDIPDPAAVEQAGKAELQAALDAGDKAMLDLTKQFPPVAKGDTLQVSAGGQASTASLLRFFPDIATIAPGQSVTWTVPLGFEPHTINFPVPASGLPFGVTMLMDSKKQPHMVATDQYADSLTPNIKSGAEFPADGVVKSGLILPGQSFTLKFTKPGVYFYFCTLHSGMIGTIIVQAPSAPGM